MQEIKIPLIKRENETQIIVDKINMSHLKSNSIIIDGDSGVGKTSLAKKVLSKYINNPDYYVFYLDLNADILSTSLFFQLIVYNTWNSIKSNSELMLNVNEHQSFSNYFKKSNLKKDVTKRFYNVLISSISCIPTYGAYLAKAVENPNNKQLIDTNSIDFSEYIGKYFKHVNEKNKMIVVIDNYQFVPKHIKNLFEANLEQLKKNLSFITIYRKSNVKNEYASIFKDQQEKIYLSKFNKEDIDILLNKIYINSTINLEAMANDCYNKTLGNPKEIELYIKKNHDSALKGLLYFNKVKTLKQSLLSLPDLQKYVVLLSAMFPAGLKIEYVSKILNNILFVGTQQLIQEEIEKLVTFGYVIINSVNNDLLKPAHDKISISLAEISDEESFLEFYVSIRTTLEKIVKSKKNDLDYVYMLHCIVGLYKTEQLANNLKYVIELINIEYERCSYSSIVSIYEHIKNVIFLLPNFNLVQILDSFQKTSEFSCGIELLQKLKNENSQLYEANKIFEIKYLTQMYKFEDALLLINDMPINNEIICYKLNILQHLGRNEEVINILNEQINSNQKDKWYFLILRNSAHYFSYTLANENLNFCLDFFRKDGTTFDKATIFNNKGVIDIWNNMLNEAKSNLLEAKRLHEQVQSNEIFEVFCNLGVLSFLEGDFSKAKYYNKEAQNSVPTSLTLDHIVLKINEIIFELALKIIDPIKAYEEFLKIYDSPFINKDPWIKFQIVYNLFNIEMILEIPHKEKPEDYYISKNNSRESTCFELFSIVVIDDKNLNISLCLSPNWRY